MLGPLGPGQTAALVVFFLRGRFLGFILGFRGLGALAGLHVGGAGRRGLALGPIGFGDLVQGILPQIEGIPFCPNAHLHLFPDDVDVGNVAGAVGGDALLAHLGQLFQGGLIIVLLVLEAAHQPAALARYLGRVEGEVLLLGHLDGHGLEIPQEGVAAQLPAAGAQAAQHLGLVPHADLAQLNAHFEYGSQVLHQFPEIDAAVGGEIEDDLGPVEGILRVHQLHLQLVLGDALLADAEGLRLPGAVVFLPADILGGGHPDHLFQGRHDLLVLYLPGPRDHLAQFNAPGGLHHHLVSRLRPYVGGVEIIYLARLFKADAYHRGHALLPFRTA